MIVSTELKKRKTRDDVVKWIEDNDYEDILLADGFDDAFLGCSDEGIAIYDLSRCVEIFAADNDTSEEDALEYIEYNVTGAFVGPKTPVFVYLML